MLIKNILKLLIGFVAISIIIIGCKGGEDKKLYVGTNAEFEPFEYRNGDKIEGFDIELIGEIAKIIGEDIEIVDIAFDGLLPALQSKKIDIIIAGMTATEERRQFVNFSEPYYDSKQSILVYGNDSGIESFDDLNGKTVGVVLGYTGDLIVSEMPEVNSQKYGATSEAVMGLKTQKIEAIVLDNEPARRYAEQNPELKLVETDSQSEEYAIAMRKEDTQLLDDINNALKTLKENGVYDNLLLKYFEN